MPYESRLLFKKSLNYTIVWMQENFLRLSLFTLGINNEKVFKNPSHESTFSCRHWYAHFHTLMVIGMEIVVEGFSITNIAHHILSYEGLHNVKRTTQKIMGNNILCNSRKRTP